MSAGAGPLRPPDAGDPVVARLLARCTFPAAGTPATCGVSGGPDSAALLALAVAAGLEVTAVHVDHGLRPGVGPEEAARVERLATAWGAGFRSAVVEVDGSADVEARARAARHAALGPDALLGHTADDQAETVLIRLLRGTGPSGLAAMRPERHPLLALRRDDTVALCEHLGVAVWHDPSNRDPRFVRNRVRSEVLPLLADVAGRDVVPLLARLAELAGTQADLLGELAAAVDVTDARVLAAAPRPVASEAVRRWWLERTGTGLPPASAAVDRILDVAAGRAIAAEVADGWRVRRSAGVLHLEPGTSGGSPDPAGVGSPG